MEWLEILRRIEGGEDEHTEFKRSVGNFEDHRRTLCAFANTDGGLLVIGVSDDRTIVGVADDAEEVQERLTGFLDQGLSHPLQAKLGRHESPDGWVHWVSVPRQRGYEPMRLRGRVYVRRGRATVEPSGAELRSLFNSFGYILTEEQVIDAADLAAVSVPAFDEFLAELGLARDQGPRLPIESDLRNRGVLAEVDGEMRGTLYGVLAFGKAPQSFPQTRNFVIRCCAYDGTTRAAPVTVTTDCGGRLDEQVRFAIVWLQSLGHGESYAAGGTRTDLSIIPLNAFREAVVNAVAHRDYAFIGSSTHVDVFHDRVEITSPGLLPNHMTADSVRAGGLARSRNESITHFLMTSGFMERRGRGWPVIAEAMLDFNQSSPELQEVQEGSWIRVVLRR